ncbi:PREDICTED: sphingomyelin synthase-related protein 1-like [Priapulus caudatus]|uniref:Sphingomyelin synthase-related protein 1-like n=1 Tax=Priapulus caudatus TaxID=37621 RepID=A0ABM1E505_PRICU|nr:PREDICTED: sphingomyelin synthase-related protein 1-like [Priapulus caudatus]
MANFKLSSDMHTNSSTRRCDEWSSEDVKEWLCSNGFRKYSEFLCDMHELDGVALIMLSEEDFRRPPLCETFQVLGDVKRLLAALRKLQIENSDTLKELGIDMTTEEVLHSGSRPIHIHKHYGQKYSCGPVQRSDSTDSPDVSLHPATSRGTCDTCFPPEIWKTLIAAGYMNVVLLVTSFVMVIVHDRVPDMETYPPLPDIFLDNFPTVPWAFILCEYIGMGLMLVLFSTLFIHKHRFIVLRRIFSIGGTVFFLRCISMVITSLSVPGIHLECHEKMYGSLLEQLKRGLEIYAGMGMATQGVRSCGDYMFSGHTCVLTLLNFFITECRFSALMFTG